MSDIENSNFAPSAMLDVEIALDNTINSQNKIDMLLLEIEKILVPENTIITSKIILNKIQKIDNQPEDSYKQCFRQQYVKAGPVGFRNAYQKNC
jgi:predicted ATPase